MNFENNDYMIAFDVGESPLRPRVAVGLLPDRSGWSNGYMATTGCCDANFTTLSEKEQTQALLNQAAMLMFWGVSPQNVLQEFSKIKIWREMGTRLPSGELPRTFHRQNYLEFNPHNPE